ncbi:predicted protein [Chaetoceros tenuissimus]|uniref:Uncharacterized protein n=1 Tax=Chaetoceros tenuissimus TaxID=426638 RepID=A0AAD3HA26_9STRA|nr:predicted protein [Chaetoceros tenuissimus]
MSPQTKKQKTEETLIGHGEDVPLPVSSPPMINNSPRQISNQESRNLLQAMAAVNEHDNRVENGTSQTHQEHSSTNGNHESNILARNVTPESKQEEPGNDDEKQESKPSPSWFTLIGGHAFDFDDAEYIEEQEYPAYGITVSVSEDGSEVDVRIPTYSTK